MNNSQFIKSDKDIWDEDEIEEYILKSFYALHSEYFTIGAFGHGFTYRDNLVCKTIGCYFPPKDRVFYSDTIDIQNDGIPEVCSFSGAGKYFDFSHSIKNDGKSPDLSTIVIFPIKKLPKNVRGVASDKYYKMIIWEFFENGIDKNLYTIAEFNKKDIEKSNMVVTGVYVGINTNDDRIIPVFDNSKKIQYGPDGGGYIASRSWVKDKFALCSSAYLDSKLLWNVDCYYNINKWLTIWLKFGVYEEHIKSLLYARDLPITASGRKRPIQHWVRAHKRRIKKGTDITQVKKHLRGVNKFEMFGYNFLITNPLKNDKLFELTKKQIDLNRAVNAPPYSDMKQLQK